MEDTDEESLSILDLDSKKAGICMSYRLTVWLILGLGSSLSFHGLSSQAVVFTCRRLAAEESITAGTRLPDWTVSEALNASWEPVRTPKTLGKRRQTVYSTNSSKEWNATEVMMVNGSGDGARNGLTVGTVTVFPINTTSARDSTPSNTLLPVWTKESESWVLAAMSVGYFIIQLPIAVLSVHVGARPIGLGTTCVCVVTSLLSVPATSWGPVAAAALCFLKGASSGALHPTMMTMASMWSGQTETSLVSAIVESGFQVGHAVSYLAAVCFCLDGEGWPRVFYLQALLGAIFLAGFWMKVSERPTERTRCLSIPAAEFTFLTTSLKSKGVSSEKIKIPYRSILTSLPVFAIVIAQFGSEWVDCLTVTSLPQFLGVRHGMDSTWVDLLTSVGFLLSIPVAVFGAKMADWLLVRPHCSPSNVRKLFEVLSKGVPALCFLLLTHLDSRRVLLVAAVYVLGVISFGLTDSAWVANCFDLAPSYTGVLVSLAEALTSWSFAACVLVVAYVAPQDTQEQWHTVAYITGALMLACVVFYCTFASGEKQTWADPHPQCESRPSVSPSGQQQQSERTRSPDIAPSEPELYVGGQCRESEP